VFVSAGLVSCTAQGGDESLGQINELPGYTDESQIDLPDVEPPGMFDPPTLTEMQDLATVAEQRGISLEEVVTTIGWLRGFSQLVREIAGRYEAAFAGAAIEQD
jgi:hypothetical protein